jgi:ferredoxin
MAKISINQNDCLGCTFCNDCAPEIFEVDQKDFRCKLKKDGKLINSASFDLSPEQLKQIKEAAENCPVQAIEINEV